MTLDPGLHEAHQGMAWALQHSDPAAAERHYELGFRGHATVAQPYRGKGAAVPLLLLVSARGNIHTQLWINDRQFAITAVYADFYPAVTALPPHGTTGAPPSTRCSAPRSGCCTGSANPPDWRRTLSMSS